MQTISTVAELKEGDLLSGDERLLVQEVTVEAEVSTVTVKTTRGEERRLHLPSRLPVVIEIPLRVAGTEPKGDVR